MIARPGVAAAPVGGIGSLSDPIQRGVAPHNAFARPLGERIAFEVAVTSPFSFTSDYGPSGWQRYSAIRSRLITLDIQPSLALAATDWLSVGAAANIQYADAWLSNALPNLTPASPDARLRLTGNGCDLGWSAGVQIRPAGHATIGLAYKSAVEHKLKRPVEISGLTGPLAVRNLRAETAARFTTPWQPIVDARVGIAEGLTLNGQAVHLGWSKFDRIELAAPLNGAIVQNYKDTWSFAVGFDQAVGERLTLRAGVQIDAGPGYTDVEDGPISRDERFYAGTAAQTDVLTDGGARDQHVLVLAVGGRLSF